MYRYTIMSSNKVYRDELKDGFSTDNILQIPVRATVDIANAISDVDVTQDPVPDGLVMISQNNQAFNYSVGGSWLQLITNTSQTSTSDVTNGLTSSFTSVPSSITLLCTRVGNIVTCSGSMDATAAPSALNTCTFALPTGLDVGPSHGVTGIVTGYSSVTPFTAVSGTITYDTATSVTLTLGVSSAITTVVLGFTFTYSLV